MRKKHLTIWTIPLLQTHGVYENIWLGIPDMERSVFVGFYKSDDDIWIGFHSHDNVDRNWTEFINAWYIANIYSKALKQCGIDAMAVLSKCYNVFIIDKTSHQKEESQFVLQFLPNGQKDVDDLIEKLPPMEYIEAIVSIAKERGLQFNSSILRIFLEKYEQIPLVLLEQLDEYDRWRK